MAEIKIQESADADSQAPASTQAQAPSALCAAEIEAALVKHGCTLVAEPKFLPDGRGGWYVATVVHVRRK